MSVHESEVSTVRMPIVRDAPSSTAAWSVGTTAIATNGQKRRVYAVAVVEQAVQIYEIRIGGFVVIARLSPCSPAVRNANSLGWGLNLALRHGHIPTICPRVAQILVVVTVSDVAPRLPKSKLSGHGGTNEQLSVFGVGVNLVIPAEIHRVTAGIRGEGT